MVELPSPCIEIIEQPFQILKFRYTSETSQGNSSNKTIYGVNSSDDNKTFPCVRICNYDKPEVHTVIQCSLYTTENENRIPHVYSLVEKVRGKEHIEEPLRVYVSSPDYIAEFVNMTIFVVKKNKFVQKYVEKLDNINKKMNLRSPLTSEEMEKRAQQQLKVMKTDMVCLKFEALFKNKYGVYQKLCDPVYSTPIFNYSGKQSKNLKIIWTSRKKGTCDGGEEIMMFVERFYSSDIKVKFYEEKNSYLVWSVYADIVYDHYHRGLVIRTPAYKEITENVTVYIQLERLSDGAVSESVAFQFEPSERHKEAFIAQKHRHCANNLDEMPRDPLAYSPKQEQDMQAVKKEEQDMLAVKKEEQDI